MNQFDAFNVAFFGIIVTHQNGTILFANTAANQMLGYSEKELLGEAVEVLIPAVKRHNHVKKRDQYIEKPSTRLMNKNSRFTVLRKDGSCFSAGIGLSPIHVNGEALISVAIHDITDIEMRANKRAHEQKMEKLGEMAMGISHNFNNFLTGIKGQAYFLGKSIINEKELKKVHRIDELCNQASNMIKELMWFGRESFDAEVFDLSLSMKNLIDMISKSLGENHNVAFKSILQDKPLYVAGSESVIHQIVSNLVNNAIYAIGEEKGEITITCRQCCSSDCEKKCSFERSMLKNVACIEVTDTGHGISQENIKKIFDPFYTTKPAGEGTGLGLSTSADIIKKLGGNIAVLSEPENGARFHFYLPIYSD